MQAMEEFEFVSVKDEVDEDKLSIQAVLTLPPGAKGMSDPLSVEEGIPSAHPVFAENMTQPVPVKNEAVLTLPPGAKGASDPLSVEEGIPSAHPVFAENMTQPVPVKNEVLDSGGTESHSGGTASHAVGMVERASKLQVTLPTEDVTDNIRIDLGTSTDIQTQDSGVVQQVALQTVSSDPCSAVSMSQYGIGNGALHYIDGTFRYHVCEMCGEVFPTAACLKEHLPVCRENQNEEPESKFVGETPVAGESDFSQTSIVQSALLERRLHTSPQLPATYRICLKLPSPSGLMPNKKSVTKEAKTPKCDICDGDSATPDCLPCKKSAHIEVRPYKCVVGNKTLFHHSKVQKCVQTGAGLNRCEICGKCFCRSLYLACHKRTHSGGKPYKCGNCGASFVEGALMTGHKCTNVHTRIMLKRCELCDKCFATLQDLANHKRTHRTGKGYLCHTCGETLPRVRFKLHRCVHPECENLTNVIPALHY